MGAHNVALALHAGRALPHPAKLVLVRMALVARDHDRPPRYFGGWESLADTLGYDVPPSTPGDKDATRRRATARTLVSRQVRTLVEAGLVTRAGERPHPGRRAEYALRLSRVVDP